jgi:hypothetical protein
MNKTNIEHLQNLTPLLRDLSYKAIPQTVAVESGEGLCVVHGITIIPGETIVTVCEVSGNAKLYRDNNNENEYVIVLRGFINIKYVNGTTAEVAQYSSHHITPGTKGYAISGDGSRVLIITIPSEGVPKEKEEKKDE